MSQQPSRPPETDPDTDPETDPDIDTDAALERTILALLDDRAPTSTICPSDAARAVGTADGWRDLMQPARDAAARLVAHGQVEITQGGQVVDLDTATGPIRIRRVRRRPS